MSIAYLLTGGLDCASVRFRIRAKEIGWQYQFAYYNLLFNRPGNLNEDQLSRIPVLGKIALLDPGLRAFRDVDERLINFQDVFEKGRIDLIFEYRRGKKAEWLYVDASSGIDEVIGNPRNKSTMH